MLTKKNKDKMPQDSLDLEFTLDRRDFFRVKPPPECPVRLRVGSKNFEVLEISAGGLRFICQDVRLGDRISGVTCLPSGDLVPGIMTVVKILPGNIAACEFVKIKAEDREVLHKYVLERQKEEKSPPRTS